MLAPKLRRQEGDIGPPGMAMPYDIVFIVGPALPNAGLATHLPQ